MTREPNPKVPPPDGIPDSDPTEDPTQDVSNDSLGTIDPADSTGLDSGEETVPSNPGTKAPQRED
jgi:hypothetical protein